MFRPFEKIKRLRSLLETHQLDAVVLDRVANFAWITDGAAGYVNSSTTFGVASVVVDRESALIFTKHSEAARLKDEEHLEEAGFRIVSYGWHEKSPAVVFLQDKRVGSDGLYGQDLSAEIAELRLLRTPEEGQRFDQLGKLCSEAMASSARLLSPGMSELEIAALVQEQCIERDVWPVVNLVAVDDRVFKFRHPLPTKKQMERYALLVLCGRRNGLVVSMSRSVYFGKLPKELREKQEAVAYVDATFISHTKPGVDLAGVFREARAAYADVGYPYEWREHHQGGVAGYEPRELLATEQCAHIVGLGEVYAFNPTIAGVKSEDTILVESEEARVLTEIRDWPQIRVDKYPDVSRPAILEL